LVSCELWLPGYLDWNLCKCLWEDHKTSVGVNSTHCWQELKDGIQREIDLCSCACARAHVCVHMCTSSRYEACYSWGWNLRLFCQMRSVESCERNGLLSWQFRFNVL